VTRPPAAVLAVDGGNSKADLALVTRDGTLLSAVRGPTISHQQVGLQEGTARLRHLADAAARRAGMPTANGPLAEIGLYTVAGADFASETRMLARAFAAAGLTQRTEVLNDTLAALRAGTDHPFGVVLICGAGVNAAAVGPSGRTARLAALGPISGDRGGGRDLGGGRSHWVVEGPAGVPVSWDAVVTRFVPNQVLAWKSEPGSAVPNAGVIRFEPTGDGDTRVDIRLSYNPPSDITISRWPSGDGAAS